MNRKQKDETLEIFAQAFHEVVVPVLEDLATKKDLKEVKDGLEGRMDKVEESLNRLDDKVERIDRRLVLITDHQADKLDDHEKRIGKLEGTANN